MMVAFPDVVFVPAEGVFHFEHFSVVPPATRSEEVVESPPHEEWRAGQRLQRVRRSGILYVLVVLLPVRDRLVELLLRSVQPQRLHQRPVSLWHLPLVKGLGPVGGLAVVVVDPVPATNEAHAAAQILQKLVGVLGVTHGGYEPGHAAGQLLGTHPNAQRRLLLDGHVYPQVALLVERRIVGRRELQLPVPPGLQSEFPLCGSRFESFAFANSNSSDREIDRSELVVCSYLCIGEADVETETHAL